jgi:hypothetical protein
MAQTLSVPVSEETVRWLQRYAAQTNQTPDEAGAIAVEEFRRQNEFPHIEFRTQTRSERRACMKGSTLAVWEVIMIAERYQQDVEQVAAYFRRPRAWAEDALRYYQNYPEEINRQLNANRAVTFEKLKQMFPNAESFEIPDEVLRGEAES